MFVIVNIQLLNANPLPSPPPNVNLSELYFSSDNKWEIEIILKYFYDSMLTDSIFLVSSSGRSQIKFGSYYSSNLESIKLITNDSLYSDLNINPLGDSIKIEYHYQWNTKYSETIIFGNIENSTLPAPKVGQSIAKYSDVFGICNSPTIGSNNSFDGMVTQTIQGKMYEGNTLYQAYEPFIYIFYGSGMTTFKPNDDGLYSTKIVSYNKIIDRINIDYENTGFLGNGYWIAEITPIQNKYAPDSIINADIHLLNRTAVGLNSIFSDKISALKIFPNPIKDLSFNYETTIPVKSTTSFIEIYDVAGKKIAQYTLEEEKGKIKLPKNVTKGTYFATLMVNKKNYGTSKILVE